jgi:LuxR family maltose regulon positive regulatory protein
MSRALALVDQSDEPRNDDAVRAANQRARLLDTKLYVPRPRSTVVPRARLTSLLDAADARKLALVTAPAGFGKTTLLAEWIAGRPAGADRAAWVSLDSSENDPRLFWAYVIRALQKAAAAMGTQALAMVDALPSVDVDGLVTTLINAIAASDRDWLLVLDDYHVIDEPSVHDTLAFLVEHLPPRMRIVIASRSEPPLPLPRLRARGELAEIRVGDLRFTADEASTFLTRVMAIDLAPSDVRRLEQRTEGWIAGLKLAALSMRDRDDAHRFVESFSGDNRHIADYLVHEALQSEPDHVRRFLLATSILDRLNGRLCDVVTGEPGSQALLEDLERRNLFVVALDDRREWFRYHHLFADVLQRQSNARDPNGARVAHQRASDWHEAEGSHADAVRHAIAAGDPSRAASLLERHWPERDRSYESAKWLARVKRLPNDVVAARPVLAMGYAWALLNSGELEAAELTLNEIERALAGDPSAFIIADPRRFQSLPVELASARVYLAQSRGEVPGSLEHAILALERVPPDDHAARATGLALVALARWGRGDLEQAHGDFTSALTAMRLAGHESDALRGTFVLGDLRVAQGRLREAVDQYERGLALARETSRFSDAEIDELHLGLSDVHREWNDLARATRHLDAIIERQSSAHRGNRQRWCVAMARVHEARGELNSALELLREAETHERPDPLPRVRPIPALIARLQIARGDLDAATSWAQHAAIEDDDPPSYLREFEHATLARLSIARRRSLNDRVLPFLERLRVAAQAGGRVGSVIELLILQALTHHALGNQRPSLAALGEALALGEPEGFLRVFLDEGNGMRDLLRTAVARGQGGAYARRVLAAFERPAPSPVTRPGTGESAGESQALTARELEILRLIAAGLRNAEIATHLSISAATVKRHIANAYGKLGVEHRTEALVRAAELKLL